MVEVSLAEQSWGVGGGGGDIMDVNLTVPEVGKVN